MKNINFSLLFKANLFLTVCIFLLFVQYNSEYTTISFALTFFAAISSAVILYILLYIILYIFKFTNKFILFLSALIFVLVNIALIVDFFIFRLYSFHINAMVINIITSPDAMDSIQVGIFSILAFLAFILFLVVFEILLIKKILRNNEDYNNNLNSKINKIITIPIILIVLGEKISYGFGSLLTKYEIVSKLKVIPLYQPLTFNRLAAKYFDYKPDVQVRNTVNQKGNLNYPLNKIELKSEINKFNIIIIASDSVQNPFINKEVSPNIEAFKSDSLVFNNHFSGGNSTRFGIFSLMYGINSTYWFSFLSQNKGAVVFDVLKNLDYDINIISSTNTNWPEFRKTAYVNILDDIKDDFEGSPWKKDEQNTNYFLNKIENYKEDKPMFSFIFLDAPHGYSYPEKFNKFNADSSGLDYLGVKNDDKSISKLLAKHKNSVYYNDYLFNKMIQKLKDKNMYDNSLIIYTSDHGEEFYEYGFFGHNSSFSKGQTNSPLIVKLPKSIDKSTLSIPNANALTSHNDIVPTILSLIGVTNNTSDYSNGKYLFDKDFKRDYIFTANWNHNAIITNDFTYVFSNLPNKMFSNEVRDTKTYKKVQNKKISSKLIIDVINENKQFY